MKLFHEIWRFLKNDDGYLIATESVLTATLTVCALVVGVSALRIVILFVFIDAAEALASRENLTLTTEPDVIVTVTRVGPRAVAPVGNKFFPTVGSLIPNADRPELVDATKE